MTYPIHDTSRRRRSRSDTRCVLPQHHHGAKKAASVGQPLRTVDMLAGIPSKCGDFHYEEMTWQIHEGSMTRSSGPVL